MKLKNISVNKKAAKVINKLLVDVNYERLTLTNEEILNEDNEEFQEILFGIKQLSEDLEFHKTKARKLMILEKEHEASFLREKVIESILAGYWDWNIEAGEEYLSPRFKKMFGYEDNEMENCPESWQRIAFEEDLPKMFKDFQQHVDSKGKIPFNSIVRFYHKNGGVVWVKCNGIVIEWNKDGSPKRAIGSHIDITEEKEIESKLKISLNEREVLLNEIHHRVKNNLHMINSVLEYQKITINDTSTKELIKGIQQRIFSMASIHEKMYGGDDITKISLKDYFIELINELKKVYDSENLISNQFDIDTIDFNMEKIAPLAFLVHEIVSNSYKYAFSENIENPTISFSFKKLDEFYQMKISDNGVGCENLKSKEGSIGLELISSFASDLDAEITQSSINGVSYVLTIK